jgi:hypothetical protein
MNYREGKLALCDILAETFIARVLGILQILVVVPNLEQDPDQVDQWDIIAVVSGRAEGMEAQVHRTRTAGLHEFDSQPKEPASFIIYHFDVFFFGRTSKTVAPE